MVIRAGDFIENHVTSEDGLSSDAVQPAGVDISIDDIFRVTEPSILTNDDYMKGDRASVPAHTRREFDQRSHYDAIEALRKFGVAPDSRDEFYYLEEGEMYGVEYHETISIPDNHMGLIFPRSRLLRCGVTLFTGIWDPGYEGKGAGALLVDNDVVMAKDMRVGQLVFIETDDLSESYDGTHQGENLD